MTEFTTKDSGERVEYASGMHRDVQTGKPRYDLIPLWFIRRLAELMARGAEKYGDRNWQLANTPEEADRMDGSGLRHHYQYLERDKSEDHLAATVFNLFSAEDTRTRVESEAGCALLEQGHISTDELFPTVAEDRPWPAVGELVNPGFGEPDRAGIYQDMDCDSSEWWFGVDGWTYPKGPAYMSWDRVEDVYSNSGIWPWRRIS